MKKYAIIQDTWPGYRGKGRLYLDRSDTALQPGETIVDTYDTIEEALAVHPGAIVSCADGIQKQLDQKTN